jgi:excisionase family DNA binding protein
VGSVGGLKDMAERLLTPSDVADRCQVSSKTVLRAIHGGRLRASRLGELGAYRMREADVEDWIERCVLEISAARRTPTVIVGGPVAAGSVGRLAVMDDMGRGATSPRPAL